MAEKNWYKDVLNFWFIELSEKQWFIAESETDSLISKRFKPLVHKLAENLTKNPHDKNIYDSAEACLAAIICFDQFTRNIYRGQGKAFAYDHLALSLAIHIINKGWDQDMDEQHRQFCYMPFMHSEDLTVQKKSLKIFRQFNEDIFKYAQNHHNIIEQFGRYPHRNEALRRKSSPEEIEYLKNAERFGQ